jgi:steroid 5-alpha reductase family enzyme
MQNILPLIIYALFICLIFSSIGFKKTVWFVSIGYAMSIVALCLLLSIFYHSYYDWLNILQVGLLGIWGMRLGSFLIKREMNHHYKEAVKDQTNASDKNSLKTKILIWIGVSILYMMMFSPAIFTLQDPNQLTTSSYWFHLSGIVMMILGLAIEAIADKQKSIFKSKKPNQFCNVGLYKWVRCPNYLGEIMVWTGSLFISLPYLQSWWQWSAAFFGWICIVLIMMGSTKRLEKKQYHKYSSDPVFLNYIKKVPVLFPWLPIYSLRKIKVYLE